MAIEIFIYLIWNIWASFIAKYFANYCIDLMVNEIITSQKRIYKFFKPFVTNLITSGDVMYSFLSVILLLNQIRMNVKIYSTLMNKCRLLLFLPNNTLIIHQNVIQMHPNIILLQSSNVNLIITYSNQWFLNATNNLTYIAFYHDKLG